ncbi:Mu transposase C-terminal domain-containing protein [Pseudomonas sichuanensis]|uniref:Mu transposase C-terminal domain-containing protein n=1 Tax=Pseudomonas sichuanensis TaxID=2213015 RepID=UPI002ABB38A0|nr:Mu transposase C-terminal domain-containing protein [Pseudomonas sichuanensis]MDZ4019113.1 Transposon Tn7 transposition protein TnsB [Pseudomonas sichuanensis]
MRDLTINTIVSPASGSNILDKAVRILGESDGNYIVITLSSSPKKPWFVDRESLIDEVLRGLAVVNVESPLTFMLRPEDELSDKEIESREKNWSLISGFIDGRSANQILCETFGADVREHALAMGVDRKQIYRLLFRYWSYGQVKNSLLWNMSLCGGRGKAKNRDSGIIPGRPPKYRGIVVEDRAIILSDRDLSKINLAYGMFSGGGCGTLKDCFNWMLDRFYRSVASDGSRGKILRGAHPTLDQLRHHGRKFYDALYALKGRRGAVRYNKDYRPLVGEASQGLSGPCQRYEIDSTIADVYLVHRVNRNWLIGRPIVYVVVDSYTRMIVGLHVGLEGPSWNGARHALYNAYTSKVEFCKRYGINIKDSDWPCFHLPVELTADRAELLSKAGETMTNVLGTVLNVPPPYRPDWKAIVESRFRLINGNLDMKFLPGGVDARRLERGDRDYELDAILDIDEFTKMIISGVLYHNKHLRLPHLLTNEMLAEDLEPTPFNIWNWMMERNIVNAKIASPSELKIALLPSEECRVTRGGIRFQGVTYTCELAERENWAANSHNFSTKYVRVWYDPNCIENCWVKNGAVFLPLSIVPHQVDKYSGFRLEEVVDIICISRQISPDSRYEALNDSADLKAMQEEILKNARNKKKLAGPPVSKAEFKRDKKQKRDSEVQNERDTHSTELHELRLVKDKRLVSANDAPVDPVDPVAREDLSPRRAAFLKLVISEAQER